MERSRPEVHFRRCWEPVNNKRRSLDFSARSQHFRTAARIRVGVVRADCSRWSATRCSTIFLRDCVPERPRGEDIMRSTGRILTARERDRHGEGVVTTSRAATFDDGERRRQTLDLISQAVAHCSWRAASPATIANAALPEPSAAWLAFAAATSGSQTRGPGV